MNFSEECFGGWHLVLAKGLGNSCLVHLFVLLPGLGLLEEDLLQQFGLFFFQIFNLLLVVRDAILGLLDAPLQVPREGSSITIIKPSFEFSGFQEI